MHATELHNTLVFHFIRKNEKIEPHDHSEINLELKTTILLGTLMQI